MGSQEVTNWQGTNVTVAGLGVSGIPAAKVLHGLGAVVTVVNDGDDERARAQAAELEALGVTVRLGDGATLPEGTELIVTAPGWQPGKPLFAAPPRRASRSGATSNSPGGCGNWTAGSPRPGSRSPAPTARPRPSRCSPPS